MATGKVEIGPGTYNVSIDGVPSTVTVPTLAAGTIVEASPTIGDTLTVSGDNGSASAVFQWQLDNADIPGANAASYDTTGQAAGAYRRGVSDGAQGPTYTTAVTVAAAPAGTSVTFLDGASYNSSAGANGIYSELTIDLSGHDGSSDIIVAVGMQGNPPSAGSTVNAANALLNGNAIAQEIRGPAITVDNFMPTVAFVRFDGSLTYAASSLLQIPVAGDPGGAAVFGASVYQTTGTTMALLTETCNNQIFPTDISGTATAGRAIIGVHLEHAGGPENPTVIGFDTVDVNADINTEEWWVTGHSNTVTGGSTTMTISGASRSAAISIEVYNA